MKKITAVLVLCLSLFITGCDNGQQPEYPVTSRLDSTSSSSAFGFTESSAAYESSSIAESSISEKSSSVPNSSSAPNSSSSSNSSSAPNSSSVPKSSSVPNSSSTPKSSSVPNSSSTPNSSSVPNSSSTPNSSSAPKSSSTSKSSSTTESSSTPEIHTQETYEEAAGRMILEMTLREKVGQLFIVRPEALSTPSADLSKAYKSVSAISDIMRNNFKKYPVGGVALFSANILTPDQTKKFTSQLLNACDIPLFIAVDEEGGRVARLANNSAFGLKKYDSAQAVGNTGDFSAALEMGEYIGGYLKQYGFNMDFAPDADVFTNPKNTVIGDRAFSSDGATAAKMAKAMAEGLRKNGIIPVYKHFPGHGDTSEDSHTGTAYANKTKEEMENCEWLPFKEAGSLDGVMAGHISAPKVTGNNVPATLSKQMISDILRKEIGFDGLVITDAMAMGAIINDYGTAAASVDAILAGCDIILMPDNLSEAFEGIVNAVNSGVISEERLEESVMRVLMYKIKYGIIEM